MIFKSDPKSRWLFEQQQKLPAYYGNGVGIFANISQHASREFATSRNRYLLITTKDQKVLFFSKNPPEQRFVIHANLITTLAKSILCLEAAHASALMRVPYYTPAPLYLYVRVRTCAHTVSFLLLSC